MMNRTKTLLRIAQTAMFKRCSLRMYSSTSAATSTIRSRTPIMGSGDREATRFSNGAPLGREKKKKYGELNEDEASEGVAVMEVLENVVTFKDISVEEILQDKLSHLKGVKSINESSMVFDAIKEMTEHNIGALAVTNSNGDLVGMFTERDYMQKVVLKGLSSKTLPVKNIMTHGHKIITVRKNDSAAKCMQLMTHKSIRHLPLVDENRKLIGMVSIGDIVKYILKGQEETINNLTDFIEHSY
jgi:CBS domain-containing protein